MKFYVGGTFTRYREVRALIDELTEMGHECALDWTRLGRDFDSNGDLRESSGDGYQQMDHWVEAAESEVDAVRLVAQKEGFFVFLGQQASLGWTTEFGMAIMARDFYAGYGIGNARILVVAPFKTTVFVALPSVTVCESVIEAMEAVLAFS